MRRIVPPDRKIKNRQAAQVSRSRQKEKMQLLEDENLLLRLENKRLRELITPSQWDWQQVSPVAPIINPIYSQSIPNVSIPFDFQDLTNQKPTEINFTPLIACHGLPSPSSDPAVIRSQQRME
jgi:hypothetical protein